MATKTKKERKPRPRRPKQTVLPGMEVETHPDIEEAADEYVEARDERMELTKRETQKQMNLLDLMHKHKLDKYETGSYFVILMKNTAEKIKVKSKASVEAEANGDGE